MRFNRQLLPHQIISVFIQLSKLNNLLITVVQSFRGRDEVDAMKLIDGVLFPETPSHRERLNQQLLGCVEASLPFDEHPEMQEDWILSVAPAISAYIQSPDYESHDILRCKQEKFFNETIKCLLRDYLDKYYEFISSEVIKNIEHAEISCFLNERYFLTEIYLFQARSEANSELELTLSLFDWFSSVNSEVCPIINQAKFKLSDEPILHSLKNICSDEVLLRLSGTYLEKDCDRQELDQLIAQLRLIFPSILNVINLHEKGIKAVENQLDDGTLVYINPDSAEGKAINRIQRIESDDMVTLVKAGQKIDVNAALERLKKRGYKVKL